MVVRILDVESVRCTIPKIELKKKRKRKNNVKLRFVHELSNRNSCGVSLQWHISSHASLYTIQNGESEIFDYSVPFFPVSIPNWEMLFLVQCSMKNLDCTQSHGTYSGAGKFRNLQSLTTKQEKESKCM